MIESDIDDVSKQIQDWIKSLSEEVSFSAATKVQEIMQTEGEPISYPVNWDSEKQKRAFFATNGFGKGIPYQRTGAYEQGWKVERVEGGAELSNPSPAGAIGGTPSLGGWQSQIHRGRWEWIADVVDYLDIDSIIAEVIGG